MTYLQIINLIKDTALAQPNVNSVVREFLDLNREDAKYSAVVIQDRDGSRDRIVEQDYVTYTWHLGYVDRLTYDESNRDDIISTGINIINNIVNTIRNTWFPELEVSIVDRINTFDQRFTAQCAGVYVVLAVNAQVSDCVDSESTDLYDTYDAKITENGVYHFVPSGRPVDEINITVDIPVKEEVSLTDTVTMNGIHTYIPEGDTVYKDVELTVDVHPSLSLSETYTTNGIKTITGEFNGGSVNVDVHPSDKLVETITSNGTTDFSGEWKDASITVDVHPSLSLSETYYSNGTYIISDENVGGTITVLVPEGELPIPADDEIYYLTYNGKPIILNNSSDFGANMVSNTYQNGYGILKFDGPISRTGSSSFYNRIGLKKIVLPYSVTEISYSSFANTGLQDVVMQNTVVSIDAVAFSGCFAMTTPFRISTRCELLSDSSFMDCTSLTTITIPGRCTRLEPGVFKGCSHLFNIYCNAVVPPVMDLNTATNTYDQFEGCRSDFVIRVPAGSLQAYQTATGWSDYASRIVSQ